jgi:hypothetical protein
MPHQVREIGRHRKAAPGAPALHNDLMGSIGSHVTSPLDFAASVLKQKGVGRHHSQQVRRWRHSKGAGMQSHCFPPA